MLPKLYCTRVFVAVLQTYIYKRDKVDQYGYSVTVMYFSGLFHN